MWFQGSLYITDPAYIGLRDEWGEIDEDMIVPGLTNSLVKYTGFGDGSWKVYALEKGKKHTLSKIQRIIEKGKFSSYQEIGEFCVDSGHFCVVYKKEADTINPHFEEEYQDKHFCYAVIEDFIGEVVVYSDEKGDRHFIGIGNITFFTA